MKRTISIYDNRQYIVSVSREWTFFKLPDGTEERVETQGKEEELKKVLEWYGKELQFYDRMESELQDSYDTMYQKLKNIKFYSEDEINKCGIDFNKAFAMECSNKERHEKYYRCFGIGDEVDRARSKSWQAYKVVTEIKNVLNIK